MPWLIQVPKSGLMTLGYDVCHDPKSKGASWGALVATMDLKKGNNQFFSAVDRHTKDAEMSNHLATNIGKAVNQYFEVNGCLPEGILLYRDGVGDGQIPYVAENELDVIKNTLKAIYSKAGSPDDFVVPFAYIVVTKRLNTRIFFNERNPEPGTCVDDIITLPERYVLLFCSNSSKFFIQFIKIHFNFVYIATISI